ACRWPVFQDSYASGGRKVGRWFASGDARGGGSGASARWKVGPGWAAAESNDWLCGQSDWRPGQRRAAGRLCRAGVCNRRPVGIESQRRIPRATGGRAAAAAYTVAGADDGAEILFRSARGGAKRRAGEATERDRREIGHGFGAEAEGARPSKD